MPFTLRPFEPKQFKAWEKFIEDANGGTIFHSLDFLAYHGDRFRTNEHHLVTYDGTTIFGVMPMAIFEEGGRRVARSPYGASYGGPVFATPLNYADSHEIVSSWLEYLAAQGVTECHLVLPIACCYATYSETFQLVLLEHGFRLVNRDISSVVCLSRSRPPSEQFTSRAGKIGRKVSKARSLWIETVHLASTQDFWNVLEKTFAKLGKSPSHSLEQFEWLCHHFPARIYADVAYLEGIPIAGIGFFAINQTVASSFYLCQDPEFQSTQALSLLISDALLRAQDTGFEWFDFGTSSTRQQGLKNVFRFKESFGALGCFRDTYEWTAEE